MARQLELDWTENEKELKKLYQAEKDHQKRTRLQALWHLRQGRTIYEVGQLIGVHHRTVQQWIAWYRQGGIEEVLTHRQGGYHRGNAYLSKDQESELKKKAISGEIGSIWDGVHWAKEQGIEYSYWGMRHVYNRLELRKKVPRPRNPKASSEEQEAWKKGD